jgi:hypothetical protein
LENFNEDIGYGSFAFWRSGFRPSDSRSAKASLTPAKRLNFTKKGAHSVLPSVALISGQLGADGLRTDWFNPSVASTLQKTGLDP